MKEYIVKVYDSNNIWYQNGKRHRENAPAVEYPDDYKAWFLNGERHREDGAAIEYADGAKAWYLNDIQYSEDEFKDKINKVKELTVKEIIDILGYEIKIIK